MFMIKSRESDTKWQLRFFKEIQLVSKKDIFSEFFRLWVKLEINLKIKIGPSMFWRLVPLSLSLRKNKFVLVTMNFVVFSFFFSILLFLNSFPFDDFLDDFIIEIIWCDERKLCFLDDPQQKYRRQEDQVPRDWVQKARGQEDRAQEDQVHELQKPDPKTASKKTYSAQEDWVQKSILIWGGHRRRRLVTVRPKIFTTFYIFP